MQWTNSNQNGNPLGEFLHHSFTSQMWITNHLTPTWKGNPAPPLPTISVTCSAAHLLYTQGSSGLKLVWGGTYMEVSCFSVSLKQLLVALDKSQGQHRSRSTRSRCLRERKREGKDWDCLFRSCWPLHLLSFTMKATFRRGWGDRGSRKEPTSLPQHLDTW